MLKFKTVEGDVDSRIYEAEISGRFTKKRFKVIFSNVRKLFNLGRAGYCGHEWDCCGCLSSQYAEIRFDPKNSRIVVRMSQHFNY